MRSGVAMRRARCPITFGSASIARVLLSAWSPVVATAPKVCSLRRTPPPTGPETRGPSEERVAQTESWRESEGYRSTDRETGPRIIICLPSPRHDPFHRPSCARAGSDLDLEHRGVHGIGSRELGQANSWLEGNPEHTRVPRWFRDQLELVQEPKQCRPDFVNVLAPTKELVEQAKRVRRELRLQHFRSRLPRQLLQLPEPMLHRIFFPAMPLPASAPRPEGSRFGST